MRQVVLGESKQESMELRALALVEPGEELVLDTAGEGPELRERALPVGREPDDMPATVGRIAAPLDEAALLELVEQTHELATVVAQRVGDRPLPLARALVQ